MTDPLDSAASAAGHLHAAKTFFNQGEFFRAYDLAAEALELFPGDVTLAHRAVLSLANAGATALALAKYHDFGLDQHLGDPLATDVRSLLGRLTKDQAFAATDEARTALFRQAQAIYEGAFYSATAAGDQDAYYPAINAATLAVLAGDAEQAGRLAGEVLDVLAPRMDNLNPAAADHYWVLATALEAHLVRGELREVGDLVDRVVAAAGTDDAALATTGRQLARIAAAKNLDSGVLAAFRVPTVVHFLGTAQTTIRPAEIAALIEGLRIGTSYGSLAAGADIMFAEALIARNVALNVVLPFAAADFVEQAVRPRGEDWVARFHTCLTAAKTVRFATDDAYLGDDQLFAYSDSLAMGLASLCARHLHAPLLQLAAWDGEVASAAPDGAAASMSAWREAGHAVKLVSAGPGTSIDTLPPWRRPNVAPGRRDTRAMLFGDIHGFSKLSDAQLPVFVETIMGTLGAVMRHHQHHVACVNTWGDGIYAVFPDAGRAAECALDMQDAVNAVDLVAAGLPATLRLRLGGHLGPVFELTDPVTGRRNYGGAHVSRAARIEPVTPEGCVYVTETFAAVLALHNADQYACDYVGNTEMAKHYGRLRMFLLHRVGGGHGPAVLGDIERAAV